MRVAEHILTLLGLLTLLVLAAVLYDILTDGEKKMWREAEYGCSAYNQR